MSGRSSRWGNGNPLQSSCLENPMDRGAWWATVHRVAKTHTRLKKWAHKSARLQTCRTVPQLPLSLHAAQCSHPATCDISWQRSTSASMPHKKPATPKSCSPASPHVFAAQKGGRQEVKCQSPQILPRKSPVMTSWRTEWKACLLCSITLCSSHKSPHVLFSRISKYLSFRLTVRDEGG